MGHLYRYDILNRHPVNYTLTYVTANGKTTWTLKDDLGAVVIEQIGKEDFNREILFGMRCAMDVSGKALPILTTTERDTAESQLSDGQQIINKTTGAVETLFDGGWI